FFFQAEDGIRDRTVTGVQTCCSSDLLDEPADAARSLACRKASQGPSGFTRCGLTRRLAIVGGGRDARAVWRRGRRKTICAGGAFPAPVGGRSSLHSLAAKETPVDAALARTLVEALQSEEHTSELQS